MKLPDKPSSGGFFILKADTLLKKWKYECHLYLRRKNGIGFREDVEKLKIGGVQVFTNKII